MAKSVYIMWIILFLMIIAIILIVGFPRQEKSEENSGARQPVSPTTEINLKDDGLEVNISPMEGRIVKGIIAIVITSVPSDGSRMIIMLSQKGMGEIKEPSKEPNVLVQFLDASPNNILLNTKEVKNGVYNLEVAVAPKQLIESYPWIASVQTQLVVEN